MKVCSGVPLVSVGISGATIVRFSSFDNINKDNGCICGFVIYFLTDRIVRIRAVIDADDPENAEERSYIFTKTCWDDELDDFLGDERMRVDGVAPTIVKTEQGFDISTEKLLLRVSAAFPFQLFEKLDDGRTVLLMSDQAGRAWGVDRNSRRQHITELDDDDHFFGCGESCGPVDKRGQLIKFSPRDAIGHDSATGGPMYKHVPFWVKVNSAWNGERALGIFYHTTFDSECSLGREISGYYPRFSRFVQDGGDLDVCYMLGRNVRESVQLFTELTGKPVLLPKYALGYLGSTMYLAELPDAGNAHLSFIKRCAALSIPMDGWQLSSGYTSSASGKRCVFTWNAERFPNPGRWFQQMRERGSIVSPNIKPGILKEHPMYDLFNSKGAFVKNEDGDAYVGTWWGGLGSFVDFTNPAGRKLWKSIMKEQLIMKGGIEGGTPSIWNDNNEYDSTVIGAGQAIADFDGKSASMEQLRVVQANLMSRCSLHAISEERPLERPFVICRSGCSGIQRFAQVWGGDNTTSWQTLKWNVAQIMSACVSGMVNYGCDVGGFHGPRPSAELLVRWVQNGIFQPRFSIHSANNDNTVTLPWMYGEPYTSMIRRAIKLRYNLIPYLYSLMYSANAKGTLIYGPLVYHFQADPETFKNNCDAMLGDFLLVANVLDEGAKSRRVYLPDGSDWYCWQTRKVFKGGQHVSMPVSLDTWPMFLRGGSILPLTNGYKTSVAMDTIERIQFIVGTLAPAQFSFFEDDGHSTSNVYLETMFTTRIIKTCIELTAERRGKYNSFVKFYEFEFLSEKGAKSVMLDGVLLTQFVHTDELADHAGWTYDASVSAVRVNVNADALRGRSGFKLAVSFADFDLIGMVDDDTLPLVVPPSGAAPSSAFGLPEIAGLKNDEKTVGGLS